MHVKLTALIDAIRLLEQGGDVALGSNLRTSAELVRMGGEMHRVAGRLRLSLVGEHVGVVVDQPIDYSEAENG
jgi:hypothetical protein